MNTKKHTQHIKSVILITLVLLAGYNSLAQIGINGVELPPACTNCDSTTVSGSKTASTLGIGTVATDTAAFASGYHTTASGPVSTAFGYYSEATGRYAFAAGTLAEADGNYSFAFGKKVRASASGSIVIGSGQDVGNYLVN
nr:hypothetical protein [Bacteroidota bacterium]